VKRKNHIPYLAAVLFVGLLLLVSTWVKAEDTIDVALYDVTSVSDTLYMNDTIIVIHTVCAPVCSSCARAYDKEWKYIGNVVPSIKTASPEAYIENGRLLWRDNDPYDYTYSE
jgi:hypothetical protein